MVFLCFNLTLGYNFQFNMDYIHLKYTYFKTFNYTNKNSHKKIILFYLGSFLTDSQPLKSKWKYLTLLSLQFFQNFFYAVAILKVTKIKGSLKSTHENLQHQVVFSTKGENVLNSSSRSCCI